MFEGTIPTLSPPAVAQAGALRAVAWPELVAKFAAARDLRALFSAEARHSFASFAPAAAQALACRAGAERHVNPDALAHGKASGTKPVVAANNASEGDRETQ